MTEPRDDDRIYDPRTDFMTPPEVFVIDGRRTSCDGGGGALGHPRVYLEMGDEGFVECGYCDRRFVMRGGPADKPSAG